MKKLKYSVATFLVAAFLSSCSNSGGSGAVSNPKELLAGTWKFDNMELGENVPEEEKAFIKEMIPEMKGSTNYSFNENGELSISSKTLGGENAVTKGTWKISEDGKKFTTVIAGVETTEEIAELSKSKLTYKEKDEKGNFTTFYYIK
jgi:hypothetical protein